MTVSPYVFREPIITSIALLFYRNYDEAGVQIYSGTQDASQPTAAFAISSASEKSLIFARVQLGQAERSHDFARDDDVC
jgi:hypothetical protein